MPLRFSVVVPARNEAANLPQLVDEIVAACDPVGPYEIIVVDDGSSDDSVDVLRAVRDRHPQLRILHHAKSGGQSAAVYDGVQAARAPVIVTLDGDGQNPPDQLPLLLAPLLAPDCPSGLGLVAGERQKRQDTWSKRAASRLANSLRRRLLQDEIRDTGCGLKAFRRDAYLALPFFNHQHRYLPALFGRDGWVVIPVPVTHRPRQAGKSNYTNFQRGLVGVYDLIGVVWLMRRRKTVRATEIG